MKIDLLKLHKGDYISPKKPVLLDIKPAVYLAVEGTGSPGEGVFEARLGALYSMAFTMKMTLKFEGREDYGVSRLECLYLNLGDGPAPAKAAWKWKLLIRTPEFITQKDLDAAVAALRKRNKEGDAALVRLETIHEGPCVQMLHVGPYEKECETFSLMNEYALSQGFQFSGVPHEIYLSDPRRIEPDRLKTILRQPVRSKCSCPDKINRKAPSTKEL